ncbi:MAG: HupE/UreJ family protein [Sandaracinaceae bacterium]|nr:HupE/UreJ family protein [Sandaracinaceae bacterium]
MKSRFAWTPALCLFLSASAAQAHPMSFGTLDAHESLDGRVHVRLHATDARNGLESLRADLAGPCRRVGAPIEDRFDGTLTRDEDFLCEPTATLRPTLRLDGFANTGIEVLARVWLRNGRQMNAMLSQSRPSVAFARLPSAADVARDYLVLGIEHIVTGFDHLLFVLGLLMLMRTPRHVLLAVSAFTVGHSITLVLAALGIVRIPSAPVEVFIALSILVLAMQLAQQSPRVVLAEARRSSRNYALLAAVFGLIHGLGFAGALTEIGLPADEIPVALAMFNVGVELGQLAFVCVVALLSIALTRVTIFTKHQARFEQLVVAAMGGVAVYWVLDRVAG